MPVSIEESISACLSNLQVTEEENGRLRVVAEGLFPSSFIGFAGHFPENPVLPAIVQLAAVRHLAERTLRRPLVAATYSRAKFRAMIRPDQQVVFTLDISKAEESCQGRFKLLDGAGGTIADGQFTFSLQQ